MTEVNVREEIGHLREDIDWLVTQAASAGIRPAEVARQAGVSGSYLSQLRRVATYPGKAPTPAALSRIVRALRFVTDEHASNLRLAGPATVRSIDDRLRRLEDRVASVLPPPGPPLPVSAASYVTREIDRKLKMYLRNRTTPDLQIFMVTGPPASGKTSLQLRLADTGNSSFGTVVGLDLATAIADNLNGAVDEGVQLAIARACMAAAGESDHPALHDHPAFALREARATLAQRGSALLLLDAANTEAGSVAAGQIGRRWVDTTAADSQPAVVRVVLFSSYGRRTMSVARSSFLESNLPDLTRLRTDWFSEDEVVHLAESYLTAGTGSMTTPAEAAQLAYGWFRGQPLLSHQMIEDLLLTGLTLEEAIHELDRPGTNYDVHLKHIARLLSDVERPQLLDAALAATQGEIPGPWESLLETLGVAGREQFEDSDGTMTACSCRFYRQKLPRLLLERRAQRGDDGTDRR